ncbi:hypothetical protein COO60DRAFT_939387 [Scenedesmus sp. NREL 46B-D3]|nr:hypothetical protein COO60DRAFT_939387 [Scenedesmus sp. NREL 46B-D3]
MFSCKARLNSSVHQVAAGTAAMGSKPANLLLRLLIVILESLDSIFMLLYTTWYRVTAKARPARAGGSNPPPPTVIGVILAEPDTTGISLHKAASVAAWCLAYASVQQVHLYEPSGHLKQRRVLLEGSLADLVQQQGRSMAVECGWMAQTSSSSSKSSSTQDKDQQSQHRAGSSASRQNSSQCGAPPTAAAAAGAGAAELAGSAPTTSSSTNIGQAAVVTVRLLSAEDAFLPVMDAVAQRCSTFAVQGSSPRAAVAAAAAVNCQLQQEQQQHQGVTGACAELPASKTGSCTCRQQRTNSTGGSPCTACEQKQVSSCKDFQQQQQQQGSMLPELAAVTCSSDIAAEPQLLLVFGPVLTLAGYPPYHTRAAEVQYMGPLSKASQQAVTDAVAAYCSVLQRHGA